jgi:ribonuclease HII
MFIAGIDEAGRGPVFGPMVMAIAAVEAEKQDSLRKAGVADSKVLSPETRERLARTIEESLPFEVIELSPAVIDEAVTGTGDSLNKLEARATALLIHRLAARITLSKVIIDSPTRSEDKYEIEVREALDALDPTGATKSIILQPEIKADANHPIVGAASIIAKVRRDAAIRALETKHGPLGSGYPSDPATQAFLGANWREAHDFFRKSWESYQRLARSDAQATLASFSPGTQGHADVVRAFDHLREHDFDFLPPTNPYEVVRARKGRVTVVRYTTGKTLVQGPDEERTGVIRLLGALGLDSQVSESKPRGRPARKETLDETSSTPPRKL